MQIVSKKVAVLALCAILVGQAGAQLDLKQHQRPNKMPSFDDEVPIGDQAVDNEQQASLLMGHNYAAGDGDDTYNEQYHLNHFQNHQAFGPSGYPEYPAGDDLYAHQQPSFVYPSAYPAGYGYPAAGYPAQQAYYPAQQAHYPAAPKMSDHISKAKLEKIKSIARVFASVQMANFIKGRSFKKNFSLSKDQYGPLKANITKDG